VAFPTTTVLDDFNRANATTLGANWSASVFGSSNLGITSNAAAPQAAAYHGNRWNVATYGADSEVGVTLSTVVGGVEILLRVTSPGSTTTNAYSLFGNDSASPGTGKWTINSYTAGAFTQLNATPYTQTVANGDKIGLEAIGASPTTLQAYYQASGGSWVTLGASISNSAAANQGTGSLAMEAQTSTARLDDFFGGTIVTAAVVAKVPLARPLLPRLAQAYPLRFNLLAFPAPAPAAAAPADVVVNATVGDLVLAAVAPAVQISPAPTVGNLALNGNAPVPTVSVGPTVGNLVLAAVAPAVTVSTGPAVANLTLGANAPVTQLATAPTAGVLTLGANAPAATVSTGPTVGDLVLGAVAPTVTISGGNVTVSPTVGVLTLGANAPAATVQPAPTVGNLTLAAVAPTLLVQQTVTVGVLTLGGNAAGATVQTTPAVGVLTLSGVAVTYVASVAPTVGVLVLDAPAPTVVGGTPAVSAKSPQDIASVFVTL
jgi:hypothetical protein